MFDICWPLAAGTLPARSTLVAPQFFPSGRAGCSIRKNRFFWCSKTTRIWRKSCGFLCAPVTPGSPGEWNKGHVPGARHIFVPELQARIGELDPAKPTAVYCGSGYRASIATSILKPRGFKELWNVPGSWEAWKKAKLPVEGGNGE